MTDAATRSDKGPSKRCGRVRKGRSDKRKPEIAPAPDAFALAKTSPLSYFAVCIAALAAIYPAFQLASVRERQILDNIRQLEVVAAQAGNWKLEAQLIWERGPATAPLHTMKRFAGACFVLIILGMVLGMARVSFRPPIGSRIDRFLDRGIIACLWCLIIAVAFAGACMILLV